LNKAAAFKDLIKNDIICRQRLLLDYFSEDLKEPCGTCDNCLKKQKALKLDQKALSVKIIDLLKHNKNLDLNEISSNLGLDKKLIIKTLEILVEQKSIDIDLQHNFYIKT